jgi:large subunit ribosomal protein L30
MADLKITLIRSTIGAIPNHRKIIKALGLGKLNSSVHQKDNPAIHGMIHKVKHLVSVEEWSETNR